MQGNLTLEGTYSLDGYTEPWAQYWAAKEVAEKAGIRALLIAAAVFIAGWALNYALSRLLKAKANAETAEKVWNVGFLAYPIVALAVFLILVFCGPTAPSEPADALTLRQAIEQETGLTLNSCEGKEGEALFATALNQYSFLQGSLPPDDSLIQCTTISANQKDIETKWLLIPTDGNQFAVYTSQN